MGFQNRSQVIVALPVSGELLTYQSDRCFPFTSSENQPTTVSLCNYSLYLIECIDLYPGYQLY